MSFDPITLALAKPKEIDLTKFITDYGGSNNNLTLNDLVLGLVNESAQSGGTLKHTGYISCDGIREAFSTTQPVVALLSLPVQSGITQPRFPLMVSLLNGHAVCASCTEVVYNGVPIETTALFVFYDDPTRTEVDIYVKATPIT